MYKFKLLKARILAFIFFSIILGSLFCEEDVLEFGGKFAWNNLSSSKNLKVQAGKFGREALRLSSSPSTFTDKTDMYISFDFDEPMEETGSYTLISHSTLKTDAKRAKFGEGSGLCSLHSGKDAVRLRPVDGSFFSGNSILKSFTIEFWLYPQITENGGTIFKWWSSLIRNRKTEYQNIISGISNNKLEWSFLNIWHDVKGNGMSVSLFGRSNIVPEQWSHHLITYDENTGCLEYRMNGHVEDIIYLTDTGRESSQILHAALGAPSDVLIATNYSGLIDELKVKRRYTEPNMIWDNKALFEKFPLNGGRLESNIIDTGGVKSKAEKLIADFIKPKQTDVEFFMRCSDNPFNWTEESPKWKTIIPNKKIDGIKGRFFQIACNLYPDADGAKTPILNSFSLVYDKDTRPLPPTKVIARALDASVKLSWSPSVNFDTKGYLVYFGEKKGEYFGEGSPIDVGNVTSCEIKNLKNGKIYFFAIAAYDEENAEQVGITSKEVWARPLRSKRIKK